MNSSAYIRDPSKRIAGRYEELGVGDVELEISGGRSVVEHLEDQEGGEAVARRLKRDGFSGCWVVDLATNDAANVDAGSGYGYTERIDRMMAVIGDDPVLWVDTRTMKERGHYASEHMRLFNQALEKAHARYPALHVFAWSEVAQDEWFQSDGIHFTAEGYELPRRPHRRCARRGVPRRRADGVSRRGDGHRDAARRRTRCARRGPGWPARWCHPSPPRGAPGGTA